VFRHSYLVIPSAVYRFLFFQGILETMGPVLYIKDRLLEILEPRAFLFCEHPTGTTENYWK